MTLANTAQRYGAITKTFHWLTALLIITLIPLGWYANQLPFATDAELTRKAWLFSLHKTLGVTAFFVAVLRILWALSQTKPGLLHADRKVESFAAELVHWMLYGALVIVPLSGWISHAAASGFAPIWWPFGQGLPLVPKSTSVEHLAGAVHWVATKVLILSLLLHIAGAVKHHVIDRDATLRRMLPGTSALPDIPDTPHSRAPLLAAIVLWGAALMLASALSANKEQDAPAPVALEDVSSDWQVQEGSVEITVDQFGNTVTGSFADWTADIRFDDTLQTGKVGDVTATIAVPSLTLGSVTGQALGADFFDAATFPRAVFQGDIHVISDGYEARGTLTIKDNAVPLSLPFALVIRDGLAEMGATLTLDRRSFGIGKNVNDEATLAFDVKIKIALTASRQP